VHQVDVVGPRYLKGSSPRYYFLVCEDVKEHCSFAATVFFYAE